MTRHAAAFTSPLLLRPTRENLAKGRSKWGSTHVKQHEGKLVEGPLRRTRRPVRFSKATERSSRRPDITAPSLSLHVPMLQVISEFGFSVGCKLLAEMMNICIGK